MELTKEQLDKIIESHGKWLKNEEGGECADLQGIDLRSANLRGINLQDAYLRNTNLQGADLRNVNLQCADLSSANLHGAYLRGADLHCADLRSADLGNANLRDTDLRYTDLQGVNLIRSELRGAYLPNGIYQVVDSGNSNRCTTYDTINDQVICGCWENNNNTLAEFKNRVENIYGKDGVNPNTKYYAEYITAIKFFKAVKKLSEK